MTEQRTSGEQGPLPILRRPTRWEKFRFALGGRWPDSYVEARLAHNDAVSELIGRMTEDEFIAFVREQSPYEAGARR